MEDTPKDILVLKDQTGEYYLLPLETLQRGRVPTEHQAEVERLLEEPDDVAGHVPFLAGVIVGVIIGGGTAAATIAHHQSQQEGTMTNAQLVEQITGRPFPR